MARLETVILTCGALSVFISACGSAANTPPAPADVADAGVPDAGQPAPPPPPLAIPECTVAGRWDLAIANEGGCPVPSGVEIVNGRGHTPGTEGVPDIDWTLTASNASDRACRYRLNGRADRLFRIEADLAVRGRVVTGSGHAMPGETRYGCGSNLQITGRRR